MKIFDFDKLINTITGYLETRLELFKLELKEEVSRFLALAVIYFSLTLLTFLAIVFALAALAIWTNELLESSYLGYLLVCILIIFIAILGYYQRGPLEKAILKKLKSEELPEEDEQ